MDGWNEIATAPLDQDVELWVIDRFGSRALTFPFRLTDSGWRNAKLNVLLTKSIRPAYWRAWAQHASE
jgi:hypothetical protein